MARSPASRFGMASVEQLGIPQISLVWFSKSRVFVWGGDPSSGLSVYKFCHKTIIKHPKTISFGMFS